MTMLLKGGSTLLPLISSVRTRRFCCMSKMSRATVVPSCPKFISVDSREEINRSNSSPEDGFRFRLVSYNILAQVYVKSSWFPHSPSPCLRWKARSQAILTVLKSFKADFLCIQELDEYDSFYKGIMESNGYSSIYIQRGGQKRDGCGIFYKHNSVEFVLEEKIEYNDLVDTVQDENALYVNEHDDAPNSDDKEASPREGSPPKNYLADRGDPNDPRVRLKRDCVGIMAAFKLKDPSHHLVIVATTHLYWDPEWADVKLAQAKYLLLRLSQFKTIISKKFNCRPSVIVCGDFNSTPGDKVYQCLLSGNHNSKELPISLTSVYAFSGSEPPFTNCTPDFTNTLDYIFFSPSGALKPVSFLEVPGFDSSDIVGGLPNYHHPSDHLPIGADFEVVQT